MLARWGFVLLLLWAPLALAQPASKPSEEAVRLFEEAEKEYKLQEYEKALEKYKELYRLTDAPELLFNIGQCQRKLKLYQEASTSYKTFLREIPSSPDRAKIEGLIAECEEQPVEGTLEISSTQDPAEVYLDGSLRGQTPLRLEALSPGEHQLEVRKAGFENTTEKLQITAGAAVSVRVALEPQTKAPEPQSAPNPKLLKAPEPQSAPNPKLLYGAAAGGGVAAALTLTIFSITKSAQGKELQQSGTASLEEIKASFQASTRLGISAGVIGSLALASGIAGYVLTPRKEDPKKTATLGISLAPLGLTLSLGGF